MDLSLDSDFGSFEYEIFWYVIFASNWMENEKENGNYHEWRQMFDEQKTLKGNKKCNTNVIDM